MRCLAAALLLVAAACGGDDGSGGDAFLLVCQVAHRDAVTEGLGNPVEVGMGEGGEETVEAGDLTWHGAHLSDPGEGQALSIRVTEGERPVTSDLYQLDGTPDDQFRGGHGFTGLRYAHSSGGGEVQWWCTSRDE